MNKPRIILTVVFLALMGTLWLITQRLLAGISTRTVFPLIAAPMILLFAVVNYTISPPHEKHKAFGTAVFQTAIAIMLMLMGLSWLIDIPNGVMLGSYFGLMFFMMLAGMIMYRYQNSEPPTDGRIRFLYSRREVITFLIMIVLPIPLYTVIGMLMLNLALPALLGAALIMLTAFIFGFLAFWFDRWDRETHPNVE